MLYKGFNHKPENRKYVEKSISKGLIEQLAPKLAWICQIIFFQ